ncbi:MAG: GGDEF domain-containing protein [Candidatus Adiutrix sp.]|jgi:diguanylate cyclase (GGDEF)-like protein|nr:GGDEF domain-containing protein [Candidatus Adiutrix sp.]
MSNQSPPDRKINRSMGRRLTALIVFMIVALSGTMMVVGYLRFKESAEHYYHRLGETTAAIVALSLDADALPRYLETRAPDQEYEQTMEMIRRAQEKCRGKVFYVFTVADEGINYIYDTEDSEIGEFDPFTSIDPDTGRRKHLYPAETEKQLRAGGRVDTIMGLTQYGWTITVNEPLYGRDGRCLGYVGVDFDVNEVVAELSAYLWQLATIIIIITVFFAAIYLYIIRRIIIRPINIMAKAADSFLLNISKSSQPDDESNILAMKINTGDELQSLAESLKSMVRKIEEYIYSLKLVTIKSETDGLTKLFNRGAFEQRVSAILRLRPEKDQLDAFMMIDVDYFKDVNDQFGHAAGDLVLSECARILRSVVREADVVGRLGGDEFAVFCKNMTSVAIAEDKARLIRAEWLKITPPGAESGITASIGIAFAPQDGRGYQELFAKADAALYKTKEAGRDGFTLSSQL